MSTLLPPGSRRWPNREGLDDFVIKWRWPERDSASGLTAVLRVKNEARSMPWVLPGVLGCAEAVVLVDNGSTDGTADVAHEIAARHSRGEHLTVLDYPFAVSRCGQEHLATPPDSVHSLTYYYNWSFAQVRTRHAMKWDGDMVVTHEGERLIRDLNWQLQVGLQALRWHPSSVYVRDDQTAYVDVGFVHGELFIWANAPWSTFIKGFDWEIMRPPPAEPWDVPVWACFELKWLDEREFDHWSQTNLATVGSGRKRREWKVFHSLHEGRLPPGVQEVTCDDEHVIDHLRREYPTIVRRAQGAERKRS